MSAVDNDVKLTSGAANRTRQSAISPVSNAPAPLLSPGKQDYIESMDGVTSRPTPDRPMPARPFSLPNLLTYARIAAVPAVVLCLYYQEVPRAGEWLRWVALAIFVAAGVTDFLDGYFARKWGEFSSFGRMLDPIADKLLVSACLLMLVADGTIRGVSLFAAVIILCREILVSGLREYLAGLNVRVEVTRLAKWKTTLQLVAVGFLVLGDAGDAIVPVVTPIGLSLLWLSALLTLYTGWDYFRAGLRHLID
jgi:cardiolipin synthase (CMP-forming)